jgi:glutamate racemase
LVADSLADYLERRPDMIGEAKARSFLTTGDPATVSSHATQFMGRGVTFEAL